MNCELCRDFGRSNPADVRATVPMAGERPRYWLCVDCANDIGAYVEEVTIPAPVSETEG